jgi:hypothetical protein
MMLAAASVWSELAQFISYGPKPLVDDVVEFRAKRICQTEIDGIPVRSCKLTFTNQDFFCARIRTGKVDLVVRPAQGREDVEGQASEQTHVRAAERRGIVLIRPIQKL